MIPAFNLFEYMPDVITQPWLFLTAGSLAAFIFGLGKVGFGGSVGLLSVPIMIYACQGHSSLATGLMLPLLISSDYCGVALWRGRWDWHCVRNLLPGAALGIILAAILLHYIHASGGLKLLDNGLKLGIGLIAIVFVAITVIQYLSGRKWHFRPVFWQAMTAGSLLGFTSTLAHAAGPVAGMYLLSQNMQRERYAATSNLLFWWVNQMKLPAYLILGLIDTTSLAAGLWLAPAALLGAAMGRGMNSKIPQKIFNAIIYGLLALIGLHMTIQGVIALL